MMTPIPMVPTVPSGSGKAFAIVVAVVLGIAILSNMQGAAGLAPAKKAS